jgi:diguanylate cyclase (GGDEF)-like protein
MSSDDDRLELPSASPSPQQAAMEVHCIDNARLGHFLRRRPTTDSGFDPDLRGVFREILARANDFVPSEAGSIFIDDPLAEDNAELVLIACFGAIADRLVGMRMAADSGIAGAVYDTGMPYRSLTPNQDPVFASGPGTVHGYEVHSVVCAPLILEGHTVGVLELLNRRYQDGYTNADLELLVIFAQTISASVVNAIEAHRAKEMSRRDDLTGLYNDRYLHHRLSEMIRECLESGSECGLIFLDLDHFKSINDRHGHLIGSRVLREVGQTLRQIVPGISIPARYGGDEFVIVVPDAGRQETTWVADTIRMNIEETVFLQKADPRDPVNYPALAIQGVVTCSLGIATLGEDIVDRLGPGIDPVTAKNELMKIADANMYRAKAAGRNRIVGSPGDLRASAPNHMP